MEYTNRQLDRGFIIILYVGSLHVLILEVPRPDLVRPVLAAEEGDEDAKVCRDSPRQDLSREGTPGTQRNIKFGCCYDLTSNS